MHTVKELYESGKIESDKQKELTAKLTDLNHQIDSVETSLVSIQDAQSERLRLIGLLPEGGTWAYTDGKVLKKVNGHLIETSLQSSDSATIPDLPPKTPLRASLVRYTGIGSLVIALAVLGGTGYHFYEQWHAQPPTPVPVPPKPGPAPMPVPTPYAKDQLAVMLLMDVNHPMESAAIRNSPTLRDSLSQLNCIYHVFDINLDADSLKKAGVYDDAVKVGGYSIAAIQDNKTGKNLSISKVETPEDIINIVKKFR